MCLMSWTAFVYIDETEEIVFLSFDYVNKLKSFGSVDHNKIEVYTLWNWIAFENCPSFFIHKEKLVQIMWVFDDKNICRGCSLDVLFEKHGYSLESSCWGISNEYLHIFMERNGKPYYHQIPPYLFYYCFNWYRTYVFGQISLGKQCRLRSDCLQFHLYLLDTLFKF